MEWENVNKPMQTKMILLFYFKDFVLLFYTQCEGGIMRNSYKKGLHRFFLFKLAIYDLIAFCLDKLVCIHINCFHIGKFKNISEKKQKKNVLKFFFVCFYFCTLFFFSYIS